MLLSVDGLPLAVDTWGLVSAASRMDLEADLQMLTEVVSEIVPRGKVAISKVHLAGVRRVLSSGIDRAIAPNEIIVVAVLAAAVFAMIAMIPVFRVVEIVVAVVAEIVVMAIIFCHSKLPPVTQTDSAPLAVADGEIFASRIRWFHLNSGETFLAPVVPKGRRPGCAGARPA